MSLEIARKGTRLENWEEITNRNEWDEFVTGRASVFSSWAWGEVLKRSGRKLAYFGLHSSPPDARLIAACPFFYSNLRGPFKHVASNGPVFDESRDNYDGLLVSLMQSLRNSLSMTVLSVSLRTTNKTVADVLIARGYRWSTVSGDFLLDMEKTPPDEIWEKVFRKRERYKIRSLDSKGVLSEVSNAQDSFSPFFQLYEETMRKKSYQIKDHLFFDKLLEGFGNDFKIASVSVNKELVAVTAFLCNQKTRTVHISYVGYKELHGLSPSFYADWIVVKWANGNGFRFVNFGDTSSDETNKIHQAKEAFGGEFIPRYRFSIPLRPRMYAIARRLNAVLRR